MGIVYRCLITIGLTVQYFHMPFKIKSCQQLRITIQFINYLTCEICSSSCYNSGFNLLTYILSHWLHNCWCATITNQRDPLTGPPSHWPPISLVPFSLAPQLIGPPILYCNSLVPHLIGPQSHWPPISLVPHLTGPPTHRSSLSLVPQVAPMHHPFHWSPISLVPPTHWSPISLVPHLIGSLLIGPEIHKCPTTLLERIGHPYHCSPFSLVHPFWAQPNCPPSHWSPISMVPQSKPLYLCSLVPHLIGPGCNPGYTVHIGLHLIGPPM